MAGNCRVQFYEKIRSYSTEYLSQFFFKFGYSISYKFIDRGMFEILGPTGLSSIVLKISSNLHKMQTGYIFHSTLIILIGATLFFSLREVWFVYGFTADYRLFLVVILASLFLLNYTDNKNQF